MIWDSRAWIQEFEKVRPTRSPLSATSVGRVSRFYELLQLGNQKQNLTRQVDPQAFVEGHLLDTLVLNEEIAKTEGGLRLMDLGSGCGVPGLLSWCLDSTLSWDLVESEKLKAEFLESTVETIGGAKVPKIYPNRAEQAVERSNPTTIVSRAVGKVSKLYPWVERCSTWNTLILFKGPAWEEEWESFTRTKAGRFLKVQKVVEYEVGEPIKRRRLVVLSRVSASSTKK